MKFFRLHITSLVTMIVQFKYASPIFTGTKDMTKVILYLNSSQNFVCVKSLVKRNTHIKSPSIINQNVYACTCGYQGFGNSSPDISFDEPRHYYLRYSKFFVWSFFFFFNLRWNKFQQIKKIFYMKHDILLTNSKLNKRDLSLTTKTIQCIWQSHNVLSPFGRNNWFTLQLLLEN